MNNDKTEVVVLMDASGSMESIRGDAVGGFNAFVEDQKRLAGDADLTVIFFDGNRYQKWQDGIDLRACPVLGNEYQAGSSTPLLDATGRTIEEVGARLAGMAEGDRPGRVMMIILTDGHENASQVFTKEKVKHMIRHQEDVYKWEFVFLAANVDAFSEGRALGLKRENIAGYDSTSRGVRSAFRAMSSSARAYRQGRGVANLGRKIEEDE